MKLSRDKIQRMVNVGGGSGGGGGLSQSQIDAMLAGYAQRSWVDKNYLSIDFFSSIFRIHSTEAGGDDDLIEPNSKFPNDTSHVNIEAMFGFWTDLYISALGKSPTGQPASLFLSSLGDVAIPSPQDGQVLTFNSGMWVAQTPASGVDMSQVWAAMAAVDASKQIDISHLSNALSNFLNVKEGGTVEKPVTFQDTVGIGSTLAVTGAVTMGSTLAVTGDITMGSKLVATQEWANNTFVMKSWFDQIFQVFNDQTKIAVNGDLPQDKSKMNIQAMFGFWTELYVSALGKSPDGQASLFLSSLGDVAIPSPQDGQVLTFNSGMWVAQTPASGTDMATVWNALAASDSSHQIDASHLSTALSGLFTALAMSGNDLSVTIGGVTKTLTVGYATNSISAYSAKLLIGDDHRDANLAPSYYMIMGTSVYNEFSNLGGAGSAYSGYGNRTTFTPWMDSTGGRPIQLEFNGDNIYIRSAASDSAWNSWRTNIDSGNIASQSVNYATSAGSAGYATSAGRLSGDSSYTAWGQSFWSYGTPNSISGNMSGVGDIQCTAGSRIHGNGGALYIGNANNASWVQIADMCSQSGSSYWKIYANGSASFQSVYSTGAVSSLSDIRYKDIVRHFALNIEAIANASIIQFRWKESHDTDTHVGGIAQEWQAILPDAVHETKDGKLAMDYGTIAYTSAVSLARKVVEQQKEIDDLKERLARLEALLTK